LENIAVALALVTLYVTRRSLPLTDTSYALLLAFLCVHEYGAMYSYNYAPFGEWIKPWFQAERNHYDRLVHLASGLFLLRPGYEIFAKVASRTGGWPLFLSIQAILFLGALYEIAEWVTASIVDPNLGSEFVGAQGDAWDATKDLACALGGGLVALPVEFVRLLRRR
jgi:putative membrane protein